MGTWENNQQALRDYASAVRGNISPSSLRNMSNIALGSLLNSVWVKQAQEEAERKRLLDVQRQKDEDAAKERQYKLKKMQYELDDIEDARNSRNLVSTLAPYKPSHGFDSETGEDVTIGSVPLSPAVDALNAATGLSGAGSKAVEDSVKALSLYSNDPDKYNEMSTKSAEAEKADEANRLGADYLSGMIDAATGFNGAGKAVDDSMKASDVMKSNSAGKVTEDYLSDVLSPYEINYEVRQKPKDIYNKEQLYDSREMLKNLDVGARNYGNDVKKYGIDVKAGTETYKADKNLEGKKDTNQTNLEIAKIKNKTLQEKNAILSQKYGQNYMLNLLKIYDNLVLLNQDKEPNLHHDVILQKVEEELMKQINSSKNMPKEKKAELFDFISSITQSKLSSDVPQIKDPVIMEKYLFSDK